MRLVEEPNLYDILVPETLFGADGMVDYEGIAAAAAELAHQFWLEIEAQLSQQSAECLDGADTSGDDWW